MSLKEVHQPVDFETILKCTTASELLYNFNNYRLLIQNFE